MKILAACEESQAVTIEMRKLGYEAYSCDLESCSGGHPEWHIQADVIPLLNGNCTFRTCDGKAHTIVGQWDLLIAFPPCTDLCSSGARWFAEKRTDGRQQEAINFFMRFVNADCPRIAMLRCAVRLTAASLVPWPSSGPDKPKGANQMDNKQVTAEWIAQQRQISEIVNMTYEDAPGSVVPLLKQLEKSQTAALDALEAAYAEIDHVNEKCRLMGQLSIELRKVGAQREAEKDAEIESLRTTLDEAKEYISSDEAERMFQEVVNENVRLTAELAAEKKRADAAVSDMVAIAGNEIPCVACENYNLTTMYENETCNTCVEKCAFIWRGPCEENTKADTWDAKEDAKGSQCDDEPPCTLFIDTLEGTMIARVGDYIIRGVHGEIYP